MPARCCGVAVTSPYIDTCLYARQVLRGGRDGRRVLDDRLPVVPGMQGDVTATLKLPPDVTCTHCVIQWT